MTKKHERYGDLRITGGITNQATGLSKSSREPQLPAGTFLIVSCPRNPGGRTNGMHPIQILFGQIRAAK